MCKKNKVMKYFEIISSIPRGSGNTKAISDYCVSFAEEHGLEYYQDDYNNVIIYKPAAKNRENDKGVVIQGHLDMVTEKTPESKHSFEDEGLELVYDGDYISAKDTTLGGDDGIAIAYALAILDDDTISHPALEAVFTVDEEVGMLGAEALDMSKIRGKYLLNVDSEEEGIFLAGCAGGRTAVCSIPAEYEQVSGKECTIDISGLKGGHSGTEINKERANAHILMGRILDRVNKACGINIVNIQGGTKDNVIPNRCMAKVVAEDTKSLQDTISNLEKTFKAEYKYSDRAITVNVSVKDNVNVMAGTKAFTEKVIQFLMLAPQGIYGREPDNAALVETSLNMGSLKVDENGMKAVYSVRSSVKEKKEYLCSLLEKLCDMLGGEYSEQGDYPAWQYSPESKLREVMVSVYREMFKKEPKVETIHAGVECGYFAARCEDIDIVSFGPDIYDIHTVNEKMSLSSVERTYELILEVLNKLK